MWQILIGSQLNGFVDRSASPLSCKYAMPVIMLGVSLILIGFGSELISMDVFTFNLPSPNRRACNSEDSPLLKLSRTYPSMAITHLGSIHTQ